jgi:hypothetical protein
MPTTTQEILAGASAIPMALALFALTATGQQVPQITKETIKGEAKVTTEQLSGTVLQAEGNTLVVRMSSGEVKQFNVPESRKFMIDGKELTVHDLQSGTKLQATVTTTTTPITERTTTIGSGTVWFVAGNSVTVTLPDGENKLFNVPDSYRFIVNGEKASVHDLRKGMQISAQKIVEEPRTELAIDTVVTGSAPTSKP